MKNSNYLRCESCFTIKGSRQSNKTITRSKKGPSQIRHESNMSRLKKISQKITPAVSTSLLLKKRSRILHIVWLISSAKDSDTQTFNHCLFRFSRNLRRIVTAAIPSINSFSPRRCPYLRIYDSMAVNCPLASKVDQD